MSRKTIWRAVAVILPLFALLVINSAIGDGMTSAFSGHNVNVMTYMVKLIIALTLICGAIYAGVRATRLK